MVMSNIEPQTLLYELDIMTPNLPRRNAIHLITDINLKLKKQTHPNLLLCNLIAPSLLCISY